MHFSNGEMADMIVEKLQNFVSKPTKWRIETYNIEFYWSKN